MRFGNLIPVSTILHLVLHSSILTVSNAQQLDYLPNSKRNAIVSNPGASIDRQHQPSVIRLWLHPRQRLRYHFNKYRGPDRRLFFSFNQFLLSMVAPRLMRYQFDLMMHSVVSELFKKILVPAIGTASGESNSLFSSIASLLRFRQNAPRAATTTVTTTAPQAPQPNLDVQRLLDNAQKLITLQKLLRSNGQANPNNNNRHNHVSANRGANPIAPTSPPAVVDPSNHNNANNIVLTDNQTTDRLNFSASQSKSSSKSDHPIHFAISTKEFINFIQSNLKLNPSAAKSANNTESNRNASPTTNKSFHVQGFANNQQMPSMSRFATPNFDPSIKVNTESNSFETFGHKERKLEDFKMSHLAYIDTEVPNYGNQLVTRDPDSHYYNEDLRNSLELKNQLGLIDSNMLGEKEQKNLKSDDMERANRWNDVLVNMNRINEQQQAG